MYDELFKEDMENLLQAFAEKTRLQKQSWECTEYNPISLIEDFDEPNSAYISHSFTVNTYQNERLFDLNLTEEIYIPSGKGNISGSLEFKNEFGPKTFEFSLTYDSDYDDCNADNIMVKFSDSPILALANAIVPVIVESEAVDFGFSYARFIMQTGVDKYLKLPLVQLAEKLMEKKDALNFHRIILDTKYRNKLLEKFDAEL
ncbi:hypothetical protein QMP26_30165 [Enterocloster clostridioformis]